MNTPALPAITTEVMTFRRDRAEDLKLLREAAQRAGLDIKDDHQLKIAIKKLEDDSHYFAGDDGKTKDGGLWGYEIQPLIIELNEPPDHAFPDVDQIKIHLNISFAAACNSWNDICDPTKRLNLEVVVIGFSNGVKKCIASYHLDKHVRKDAKDRGFSHPLYHIQFSGGKIRRSSLASGLSFDDSSFMFLDTPRLAHHPLELVLAIDFLASNYLPKAWHDLKRDHRYTHLFKTYQKQLWEPYVHAIASRLKLGRIQSHWDSNVQIWPSLR